MSTFYTLLAYYASNKSVFLKYKGKILLYNEYQSRHPRIMYGANADGELPTFIRVETMPVAGTDTGYKIFFPAGHIHEHKNFDTFMKEVKKIIKPKNNLKFEIPSKTLFEQDEAIV